MSKFIYKYSPYLWLVLGLLYVLVWDRELIYFLMCVALLGIETIVRNLRELVDTLRDKRIEELNDLLEEVIEENDMKALLR